MAIADSCDYTCDIDIDEELYGYVSPKQASTDSTDQILLKFSWWSPDSSGRFETHHRHPSANGLAPLKRTSWTSPPASDLGCGRVPRCAGMRGGKSSQREWRWFVEKNGLFGWFFACAVVE